MTSNKEGRHNSDQNEKPPYYTQISITGILYIKTLNTSEKYDSINKIILI